MELTKNQKLWIEALRSGKYEQAVGVLESTSGGFCCLGVACKVAEEHGVKVIYDELGTIDGNHLDYQRAVQEWLGLINVDGFPSIDGSPFNLAARYAALTAMNDNGVSFEEIADIIEANPEVYFYETNDQNE